MAFLQRLKRFRACVEVRCLKQFLQAFLAADLSSEFLNLRGLDFNNADAGQAVQLQAVEVIRKCLEPWEQTLGRCCKISERGALPLQLCTVCTGLCRFVVVCLLLLLA